MPRKGACARHCPFRRVMPPPEPSPFPYDDRIYLLDLCTDSQHLPSYLTLGSLQNKPSLACHLTHTDLTYLHARYVSPLPDTSVPIMPEGIYPHLSRSVPHGQNVSESNFHPTRFEIAIPRSTPYIPTTLRTVRNERENFHSDS